MDISGGKNMRLQKIMDIFFLLCLVATVTVGIVSCTNGVTTTTAAPGGPGGRALVNSDSVITATIQAIRQQSTGYPWELDILVNTTQNVGDLPNPTKDNVGQTIAVKTDVDMSKFNEGDNIQAHVKYTGDVPKPGITLYLFNVALQQTSSGGY
jgi:hypothetical protein